MAKRSPSRKAKPHANGNGRSVGLDRRKANGNGRMTAMDFYSNFMARMGHGTPSLTEGTTYEMVRLSLNYFLMLTLYRNSWIMRRVVDLPADDMTRAWPSLNCDLPPDDIQKFDRTIYRTRTPQKVAQALKWARLYGGAGCLMAIKGHEEILDEPLDLDDVMPNSYLGLIPFDRWVGIYPVNEISQDLERPMDWGLPEFYECTANDKSYSFRVHSSRLLRFIGLEVPTPELQAMSWWGLSVIEPVYETLKMHDNSLFAMINLLFRANVIGQINPELAQLQSGLGTSTTAAQRFYARMEAQNHLLNSQSMLLLGKDGKMESVQYSFAGVGEVLEQIQMEVAGAAEMTVTRLFGRTITGLGQTNDSDERQYELKISKDQNNTLRPQLDKLYPVVMMSELGEIPDDLDYTFPSVRVLTQEEKAEMTDKASAPILAAFNSNVISQKTTLKELRELSDVTDVFTNITDEDIDNADDETLDLSEMAELGGGAGPGAGGKGPAKPTPQRQLKRESGGAMDQAPMAKRVKWQGLDISIENPAGSVREGVDAGGKKWSVRMSNDYGYIRNTEGHDGDHVDVFMGPDESAQFVYIVNTRKAPEFVYPDEQKCFLNFPSKRAAREAFFANYDSPYHFGSIETMAVPAFITRVLETTDTVSVLEAMDAEASRAEAGGGANHPASASQEGAITSRPAQSH